MKTKKLSIIALIGLSTTVLFSCKKDEIKPTSSSVAEKATISGYAYAELDLTTAGNEFAPNGTKVIASTTTPSGQTYNYTGTVTDGKYDISIPVGRNPKNYIVSFENFTVSQIQADGSKLTKSYGVNSVNVFSLVGSQTKSADVTYNVVVNNNSLTQTISYNGTAKYDADETDALTDFKDIKNIPDGTKVYLINNSTNEKYVTTTLNGEYKFAITLPAGETLFASITFEDFKASLKTTNSLDDKIWSRSSINANASAGSIKIYQTVFYHN